MAAPETNNMHTRDVVFPEGRQALYTQHRYAPAVRSGGLLFVSGQVGSREDGSPEPDFAGQVRQAFAQLQATLKAAGCGLDDVLDVTTFHTDPERQLETVLAIKDEVFRSRPIHLDGGGRDLAVGFRLRDQGDRPPSRRGGSGLTRPPERAEPPLHALACHGRRRGNRKVADS